MSKRLSPERIAEIRAWAIAISHVAPGYDNYGDADEALALLDHIEAIEAELNALRVERDFLKAGQPVKPEIKPSKITKCFIRHRDGDEPLFDFYDVGMLAVNLDGYVVVPVELVPKRLIAKLWPKPRLKRSGA